MTIILIDNKKEIVRRDGVVSNDIESDYNKIFEDNDSVDAVL